MANKIEILISASDKASGVIGGVNGAISNFGTNLADIGSIVTGVESAINIAKTAIEGLGSAVQFVADAAPIQNVRSAFDGLTEAAGTTGDAVLKGMQEASGGMIEAEKLMTGFNKAAQLVSPDFAFQLTDAMGPLQKVAASTGQDLDYMLNSLVTGVGRQSKMILDNLGITIDLEKAYSDWAATSGEVTRNTIDNSEEMGELSQKLEFARREYDLLAQKATAAGEAIDNSAEMSNLTNQIDFAQREYDLLAQKQREAAAAGKDVGAIQLQMDKKALQIQKYRDSLAELSAEHGTVAASDEALQLQLDKKAATIAELEAEYNKLSGTHGTLSDDVDDLVENMTDAQKQEALMAQVMELLNENTKDMPDITESAAAGWARLQTAFEDNKDALGLALIPLLETLLPHLEGMLPIVEDAIGNVAELAQQFSAWAEGKSIEDIAMMLQNLIPPEMMARFMRIKDAIENLFMAFQEQAPEFQEEVQKTGDFLQQSLGDDLLLLFDNIANAIGAMAEIWREHGDEIMAVVGFTFRFLSTVIMSTINVIVAVVTAALQFIQGDFEGAGRTIQTTVDTMLESIANLFGTSLDEIKATWQNNWNMLVTIVEEIGRRVGGGVSGAFNGIKDGITNALRDAWNTAWGMIGSFSYLGNNIIDGLVTGFQQNLWKIRDFFTGMVNDIVNNVKNMLGIHSPSSVFADIGKQLSLGMAQGIGEAAGAPLGAMGTVTQGLVRSSTDNSQRFYGPISIQADSQSTLTGLLQDLQTAAGVA